jgi:2',3'-cyclic-nucleotide 2'-phosphodiesterase (5'-nucleotidase family)
VDAIVGAHSHTNPASPESPYKYLPTIVAGPGNTPVLVSQAYRYNNTLGEEVIGVRPKIQLTVEDVQRLFAQKAIDNAGIRSSLLDKLASAKTLFDGGQTKAAINQLNAFINHVKAQSGKHITKAAAATLIADATWMIAHKGGYVVVARAGQYLSVTMATSEDPAIKAIVDPYVAQLSTYRRRSRSTRPAPMSLRPTRRTSRRTPPSRSSPATASPTSMFTSPAR